MLTFPKDFAWGAATASYQIEGGWLEGGKGFSIWDAFAHTPGKITDSSTADVTCDHFHRWRDDVALMADLGLNAYRFSIAWSRILPAGRGTPNAEGIRFYSDLIDELLKRGITPWVTLYHWDLPLALQLELDGWTNPALADIYKDYAVLCFNLFGDRVKRWTTFNEPWVTSILGYGQGIFAPGRTSNVEPYLAAHTMLRAHGMAVREYRDRFQAVQKGLISMTTNCDWREPLTSAPSDVAAAERSLEFFLGWFADPLYRGDYPEAMRQRLGSRLPLFTSEESAMIRGSQDFFGLNHYTTMYATDSKAGPHPPSHPFVNAGIEETRMSTCLCTLRGRRRRWGGQSYPGDSESFYTGSMRATVTRRLLSPRMAAHFLLPPGVKSSMTTVALTISRHTWPPHMLQLHKEWISGATSSGR